MNLRTITAPATSSGSALGIIRVSGENAHACLDGFFSKDVKNRRMPCVVYGHLLNEDGSVLDEVVVTLYRAPHSFTGENCAEISCHGSTFIMREILDRLLKNGCELARPGEFTQRAFLNGKMDLTQAEAVADVIASESAAQHKLAMNQLRGGIKVLLHIMRDKLLNITALLELELDFSDHEDLEFADRGELLDLARELKAEMQKLSSSFRAGNAVKNGVSVAIVGAPNVGKSTLFNALLQDERSIVSDIQGTTRDSIEDTMTIGGILFRFIDTAGLRHTDDTVERMGIERTRKISASAQIVIVMTERGKEFPEIETEGEVIFVTNKCENVPESDKIEGLRISAKMGEGLDELRRELLSCSQASNLSSALTNPRHKEALDRSIVALERVIEGLEANLSGDLVAEDLREVLSVMGEITGEITNDEVLGEIFGRFCIGK